MARIKKCIFWFLAIILYLKCSLVNDSKNKYNLQLSIKQISKLTSAAGSMSGTGMCCLRASSELMVSCTNCAVAGAMTISSLRGTCLAYLNITCIICIESMVNVSINLLFWANFLSEEAYEVGHHIMDLNGKCISWDWDLPDAFYLGIKNYWSYFVAIFLWILIDNRIWKKKHIQADP